MLVAIGNDHRGVGIRDHLFGLLESLDVEVLDLGAPDDNPVDYPDVALAVAQAVIAGKANFGILICGTGIGMSIAANKVPGIRAAICNDEITAELSRKHNNANILCLPAALIGGTQMDRVIEQWLATDFDGGRHQRRNEKIAEIEQAQAAN